MLQTTALVQTEIAHRSFSHIQGLDRWPQLPLQLPRANEFSRHHKSHSEPNNHVSLQDRKEVLDASKEARLSGLIVAPRSSPADLPTGTTAKFAPTTLVKGPSPAVRKQQIGGQMGDEHISRVETLIRSDQKAPFENPPVSIPSIAQTPLSGSLLSLKEIIFEDAKPGGGSAIFSDQSLQEFQDSQNRSRESTSLSTSGSRVAEYAENDFNFTAEFSVLQSHRAFKKGLKAQLREMKMSLRMKANVKAIAEDRFFQRVRKKELDIETPMDREGESILELMQQYEQARYDHDPAEDDYHLLEDQLDVAEFELERLESAFFDRWKSIPHLEPALDESHTPVPGPPSEIVDLNDEDLDISYHPKVVEYLSKLGDLEIAQERLDEILDEQENLEEQRALRATVGMSLGPEEQDWLDASENMLLRAEAEVKELEEEVEVLKQKCIVMNLVGEDGEPIDLPEQEQEVFENEAGVVSGSHVSEYSRYPILLPKPLIDNANLSEDVPDPGERKFTLGGKISKWMLDRLRTSALEVSLLARTYEEEGKGKQSSETWQVSVLRLWYEDGTVGVQARTSTAQGTISDPSGTLVKFSDILSKTVSGPLVQIRIWSSLPARSNEDEHNDKIRSDSLPPAPQSGITSHSQ